MGYTRKGSSPSKPRSKSKGRPRSQSSSGKSPKKTPGKRSPSKSPSRKATPKNKPKVQSIKKDVSKTPTPAPRSRSTSRGRKANTAPAASKSQKESQSRSRSRSRTTTSRKPQLATATVSSGQVSVRQPQRPSSSLSQFLNQQQQGGPRSRGQSSSMNSGSSSLTSSNRSPRGASNKGQGVVKAIWNGTSQKLRKVFNGGYLNTKYWSKTKKHIKGHWKQWLTAILMLLISYFAYTFSKELIASVKQLSQTISEYAEEKRKIFG